MVNVMLPKPEDRELCNFILSTIFVVSAGLLKNKIKDLKGIVIGSLVGAVAMAGIGILTNYYIVYPIYTLVIPMDAILGAYRLIYPKPKTCFMLLLSSTSRLHLSKDL